MFLVVNISVMVVFVRSVSAAGVIFGLHFGILMQVSCRWLSEQKAFPEGDRRELTNTNAPLATQSLSGLDYMTSPFRKNP